MAPSLKFDAIVLCGGSARRLGGIDKAGIVVGGRTLLERALEAVAAAERIVAVGPRRDTTAAVLWAREDPPGGGPVIGIAAGLQQVEEETVFILGVDFPFVDRARVTSLVRGLGEKDGAILGDDRGHRQFLVGAYRRGALTHALQGRDHPNMAVKELVAELQLEVIVDTHATRDCDTWEDVAAAEELLR